MKQIHWLLAISLLVVSNISLAQTNTFPDTNFLKQEYARQQAIKAELDKLQSMQLKYQQDKKNTSSEKSTLTSLPVQWEERGPTGMPDGINQILLDANDPSGKKAWAATWGGLWYNNDITADSSWHLSNFNERAISIAQNPLNPQEIFVSSFGKLFMSINGGVTWNIIEEYYGLILKFNSNGDLFSFCNNNCGPVNFLFKLNRSGNFIEQFIDIQTTFWQETNPELTDLKFDHENLIYIALKNGNIYRSSTPSGGTWTNIMTLPLASPSEQTYLGLGKDSNNNKIIYAINLKNSPNPNNFNWIRKSINGGNSWTNLSVPTAMGTQVPAYSNFDVYVEPNNPSNVAFGSIMISSSVNGGSTWKSNENLFYYINSISKSTTGNNFYVTTNSTIQKVINLFDLGTMSLEPRIKDLNTSYVYSLEFRNDYNDSLYFNNSIPVKGTSIWEKHGDFNYYNEKTFDNNETDLVFSFNPSLVYFNRNNEATYRNNIDIGNQYGIRCYDEKSNIVYGFKFSSQINNQTILYRVKNIGNGNEVVDNLLINKFFQINQINIVNDSTLIILTFNQNNNLFELYKLSIQEDNTVNYTLVSSNANLSKLSISRSNPNLFVIISNQNLDFSSDGGLSWQNKTNSFANSIVTYAINPANPDQVFISNIYNQIFYTNNFTSEEVQWEIITGDLDFIPRGISNIWYRETDGKLFISNGYRGIFSTNYFQTSVPDSIIIANYTKEACVNDSIKVSFYKNGAFSETNTYELWISGAAGNFTNATKIGTSSNSPVFGIIPDHLASGTNYKLRVISTNTSVAIKHADTGLFEVKKGSGMFLSGYPKAINATQNGFVINAPVNQNAEVWYVVTQTGKPKPTIDQIISGIDSAGIAYLVADSVIALANASNPIIITGLMSGTNYDAYVAVKLPTEECFSAISKVTFSAKGTPISYCIPQSINGCTGDNYLSELRVFNFENNQSSALSNFNSGCGPNAYSFNSQNIEVLTAGINIKVLNPRIHDFEGTFPSRGLAIWIDFNENGDFEDPGELMNSYPVDMNNHSYPFYANPTVSPGIKRMRIRLNSGTEYTFPMSPCATYQYGETEDYLVKVETNEPYIFANLDKDTVGQCEVIKVVMDVTGSYNFGNVFRVELSDKAGNFADSTVILSGLSVHLPVNIQIPHNLPSGNGYKLRVVSTDPVAVSYESATFTITPQIQEIITDFSSASHTFNQIGTISAKNKNTNTAKVNFKAWNSVLLLPNFEAKPSSTGSFKAEIVGCDN